MEEDRTGKRKNSAYFALSDAQPKPAKFSKPQRPGQRPPSAPKGMKGPKQEREGSQPPRGGGGKEPSKHEEEMERKQKAFDAQRPENIQHYCEYAGKVMEIQEEADKAVAAIRQQAVDEAALALLEAPCGQCEGTVKEVGDRSVEVIEFTCRYALKVPEFGCDGEACPRRSFSVEPIAVGCCAASPTIDCAKWFSVSVVTLFRDIHFRQGLSGAGGSIFALFFFSSHVLLVSDRCYLFIPILQLSATRWTTRTST